ncbi:MAG: M28 family peptidase [bacterium]
MNRMIITAVAAAIYGAAALALPGDVVVLSAKAVGPDEAAGFYYLGSCAAGYLYNGSSAAVGRAAPYRVLDDQGRGKYYFLVSPPGRTALTATDMATVGDVQRLGDDYLLAVAAPGDVGILLAMEPRLRIRELRPTTRVAWRGAAETPPKKKNPRIEAAINTITAEEYAGYIGKLQSYGTRYSFTPQMEGARNWLRNWFAAQNLDADWHAFACGRYEAAHYPEAGGNIYLDDYHCMVRRSRDGGASWDTLRPAKGTAGYYYNPPLCWWFDGDKGLFAGIDGYVALTADGGDSWQYVKYAVPPSGGFLVTRGVAFATREIGWLSYTGYKPVGGGSYSGTSYVLKTENGGRSWREVGWSIWGFHRLASYDARRMWALHYAVGSGTRFYYSNDGGQTWRACVAPISSQEYVFDAAAVGPREAWGVTTYGRVLRTTDGVNWQEVDTGFTGDFRQVEFPTATRGYIGGDPLIKTDDGGRTWARVKAAPAFEYVAMAFADARHGVIADNYGDAVYRTDDGGLSWTDISGGLNVPEYNVVAERKGTEKPDEIIIVGGHHDSISTERPWVCPGAEDDASGTAVAMCAARAFRNLNFKRTVRFMGFGDEEAYLLGSEAYAKECAEKGEKIIAVLNADMVSYDEEEGSRDDLMVGAPDDAAWLVTYLKAVGGLYGQKLIYEWDGDWVSDDWSFIKVGYAALGVIEGDVGEGGSQEYPWYHTPEDTLDKLQPAFGARCARDLAATLAHLAGVAGIFPEPPPPGTGAVPFARPFAVYPNPYSFAATIGGVSFVGIKSPATVEIYDLAGRCIGREEVAAGRDECVWRPATPEGATLAPGVYLYRVEGQDQKEAGKIVVAK